MFLLDCTQKQDRDHLYLVLISIIYVWSVYLCCSGWWSYAQHAWTARYLIKTSSSDWLSPILSATWSGCLLEGEKKVSTIPFKPFTFMYIKVSMYGFNGQSSKKHTKNKFNESFVSFAFQVACLNFWKFTCKNRNAIKNEKNVIIVIDWQWLTYVLCRCYCPNFVALIFFAMGWSASSI